jgi:hypothetical protein
MNSSMEQFLDLLDKLSSEKTPVAGTFIGSNEEAVAKVQGIMTKVSEDRWQVGSPATHYLRFNLRCIKFVEYEELKDADNQMREALSGEGNTCITITFDSTSRIHFWTTI